GLAVLPQILPVVEVAGNSDSLTARTAQRLQRKVGCGRADSRRNAGDVEPPGALERLVPIDLAGLGDRNRGIGAVVDHLRGALVRPGLQIIDAQTSLSAYDPRGIDSEAAQFGDSRIGYRIFGKHGDVGGRLAELRQRDGDVGLAASESRDKLGG